jgi:hypothetical protein
LCYFLAKKSKKGAIFMAKDYSPQLSSLLVTLRNINDHLKEIDDHLLSISQKMNTPTTDGSTTFKHIVVIKPPEKK